MCISWLPVYCFYEIPGGEQAGLVSALQLSFWYLFCLILYYLEMEFGLCITKLAYFEMLLTWEVSAFYP